MVILRGLPGSGKTVITKKLVQLYSVVNVEKPVVCSADQFFVNEKGNAIVMFSKYIKRAIFLSPNNR